MRVLIASAFETNNDYIKMLVTALRSFCEVVTEVDVFWKREQQFDIIHIQWPEELFYWKSFSIDNLMDLKETLNFWKNSGSKIVATRHNILPNNSNSHNVGLYDYIYKSVDAVVHLGKYSSTHLNNPNRSAIIEHPNYSPLLLLKNVSSADIPNKSKGKLFLSFGSIRYKEEEKLLIAAFLKVKTKDDILLVTDSFFIRQNYGGGLNLFFNLYKKIRVKCLKKQNVILQSKRISNEDLFDYFHSSDVIISPRQKQLNSGVIYLALTYNKVIVSSNYGNIGEALQKYNMPSYEPGSLNSLANSLLIAKSTKPFTIDAYNFFLEQTAPMTIAKKHYELYSSLF